LRNVATNEIRWNPPRNGFVEGKTKPSSLEKKWFRCMIGECCSRQYFSIEEGALCSKGHFICIADFSKHCESQVEDDVLAQFEKQGEAILCPSYGKTKCKPFTDEEVSRFVNLKAFESIVRARMKVLKRSKEKEIEDRIKHEVSDREKKRVLSAREKLIDEKCSLVQEILNMNKCPSCRCDILEEEYQLSCSCNGCKINFCCYCKKSFSSSDEALEHTCCCPKGLGSMNQGKGNFQHMMIRRIKNCLRRVCRDDHRVFEGVVERLHDELDKLSISVDPKTVSLKCSLHHCCVGVEAKFLEEDGISCSNGHFLCSDDFSRYCKEKLQLESRDKFEADEGKIYCPLREEGGCRLSRAFGVKEIAEHTTDDIFKTLMKIRANLLASNEKRVRNGPRKECQIYAECDTDTLHQDDGIECSNGHFICAKDFTRLVESQTEILLRFEEKGGMVRCPFFDKGCNSEPFTDDEIKLTSVDAFEALMKGRMRLKESVYAREIEGLQRKLRDYENKEAMEFPERRKRDIQDACQYITENILNVHCPGYKHVYAEVEGGDCMATTYGTYFCGYCEEMEETSHQAHEHTSQCLEVFMFVNTMS